LLPKKKKGGKGTYSFPNEAEKRGEAIRDSTTTKRGKEGNDKRERPKSPYVWS